jgi:hypothetical protein
VANPQIGGSGQGGSTLQNILGALNRRGIQLTPEQIKTLEQEIEEAGLDD